MHWLQVPKEPPSRLYPVGTVIEDQKAIYKVLEPCVVQDWFHKYKCQVLERKQSVPKVVGHQFTDIEWVMIVKQTEHLLRINTNGGNLQG